MALPRAPRLPLHQVPKLWLLDFHVCGSFAFSHLPLLLNMPLSLSLLLPCTCTCPLCQERQLHPISQLSETVCCRIGISLANLLTLVLGCDEAVGCV